MYLFDPPLEPPWTRDSRVHEEDEEQERHRGELGDRADGRDERLVPAARKEGQPLHKTGKTNIRIGKIHRIFSVFSSMSHTHFCHISKIKPSGAVLPRRIHPR